MSKLHYTLDETVCFFNEIKLTFKDFLDYVYQDLIKVWFLYDKTIYRDYCYAPPSPFEDQIRSATISYDFKGYINPLDVDVRRFLNEEIHTLPVLKVNILGKLDRIIEAYEPMAVPEPLDEKNFQNDHYSLDVGVLAQALPFTIKQCFFSAENLKKCFPDHPDFQKKSLNNNDKSNQELNDKIIGLEQQLKSLKTKADIDNPMQISRVAKMLAILILKAYPTLTAKDGLETHALMSKLESDTGLSQKTVSKWLELAKEYQ